MGDRCVYLLLVLVSSDLRSGRRQGGDLGARITSGSNPDFSGI